MSQTDISVPDLGNFDTVAVVEVLVKVGDVVEVDTPLITLETEKATMDVPSSAAGTVTELLVKAGDKVGKGTVIARLAVVAGAVAPAVSAAAPAAAAPVAATALPAAPAVAPVAASDEPADRTVELLVLGAGPGGYTAAFRAADLGLKVTMIERWDSLGGVCLNVGCIPSKALLHAAKVIDESAHMSAHGVSFGTPQIDLDKLRGWKDSVIKKLTGGLTGLAKQRKVEVVHGAGRFVSPHVIEVTAADGTATRIGFKQCVVPSRSSCRSCPTIRASSTAPAPSNWPAFRRACW